MWGLFSFLMQVLLFTVFAIIIAIFINILYRKLCPPPQCAKCLEHERMQRMQEAMKPAQQKNNEPLQQGLAEESDVD